MAVSFEGVHFPKEVILMGVRWSVAYPLSTRHIEERLCRKFSCGDALREVDPVGGGIRRLEQRTVQPP